MHIRQIFRVMILGAVFCALNRTQATTVIPPTFDELVAEADVIFEGTATKVESAWLGEGAERHIVTYVTFAIAEMMKGDAASTYTIRLLGGTIDGRTTKVTDAPEFQVGDHDILFVQNNGSQFIPLVGIMHGRYHVSADVKTGSSTVTNNGGEALSGQDSAGHLRATTSTSTGLSTDDFKAAIRAKLNAK